MNEASAVTIALLVGLVAGAAGASWKLIWGWISGTGKKVAGTVEKVGGDIKKGL